jgi:hypothetical protein
MSHVRRAVACAGALAVTCISFAVSANALDPASKTSADAAVTWLKTQQQPDGGFEVAAFPGFETLDATIAIAEDAQTGTTWSTSEAVNAVGAVRYGGSGPTPFDAIDAYAETIPSLGALTAGTAAKNIVLGAAPYGFDPTAFDPAGDGTPIDLVGLMGGCSASGDPVFNLALYIVLAQGLACGAPDAAGLAAVRDAQQANGGWNYNGDPTGTDIDPDTTALAVEALVAGGADATDPEVHAALAFFAVNQQASGAWPSFGADDPNSTSTAIFAITAAGFDVASPCWRDTAEPSLAGSAYPSPAAWLRSQQQPDGRIASPNDAYPPVNTFATSQSVQALLLLWMPVARASARTCETPVTPVTPVRPTGPVAQPVAALVTPRFTG